MSWRKDVEDGMGWEGLVASNKEDEDLQKLIARARLEEAVWWSEWSGAWKHSCKGNLCKCILCNRIEELMGKAGKE